MENEKTQNWLTFWLGLMVWLGGNLGGKKKQGEVVTKTRGDHLVLWKEASIAKKAGDDKRVKELLVQLLIGFKSTLDYPAAIFYKELLELWIGYKLF